MAAEEKKTEGPLSRGPRPKVLVVTTDEVEMEAVICRLVDAEPFLRWIGGKVPVSIGKLGRQRVAVCQTDQGILSTYGDVLTILRSEEFKGYVKLVFAVGFAWGAHPPVHSVLPWYSDAYRWFSQSEKKASATKERKQRHGDVLIATSVIGAGHLKAVDGDIEIRSERSKSQFSQKVNNLLSRNWPRRGQEYFDKDESTRYQSTSLRKFTTAPSSRCRRCSPMPRQRKSY